MSAARGSVTIFHNPACGTSRKALEAARASGLQVEVVEYLKTGWTREQLDSLLGAMNAAPRDILRAKEPLAAELGLRDPAASDAAILEAMTRHPVLVERPIVIGPGGTALCRPAERVAAVLQPGVAGRPRQ